MKDPIPRKLVGAVAERQAILFVGAGLSMNVGLPSWQELVAHRREELGDDDESLVITETDYFNRLTFDTPLDIKFRSDGSARQCCSSATA